MLALCEFCIIDNVTLLYAHFRLFFREYVAQRIKNITAKLDATQFEYIWNM